MALTEMTSQNLSQLPLGQSATIIGINESIFSLKLMEMGCIPGETVSVSKIAPMGDPITISVAHYHLSLRRREAEEIIISS